MAKLKDDTHLILDGEVRVYRRERSKRWQASFNIDGHTVRISTGKRDLSEAKQCARDTFLGSRLIDRQSQKMTVAARATAERKVFAHRS
jgi:hypothetical protein